MEVLHIILTVIQCIAAVGLVVIVMVQSGKSAGLSGAIAGSSEGFMSKNKGSTLDAKLAKLTKWVAAVFLVLTFVLNLF
ncbi:MAG: preprotein translocase subunit SecG [Candidatus Avoscillospira sp.]